MLDFEIQRCARKCAKTDREFSAGETFFSVLIPEGAEVVRRDYSQEAWDGPPEGALGWWKCQLPESNVRKAHWAPHDVMLDYFERLQEQTGQEDVRYILALLMSRKRIVRVEDTETDETGREVLVVFCPRTEAEYRVPVVMPEGERARQIQDELVQLLFGGNGSS
ncbi:MAG: hypothetical protein GX575_24720 [Candidatus Anammoximicrobium sp.]|nr:hypothetical protein [Candidatus Anammoximicrobium sp.]